ncbi:hypothetical protein ACNPNP_11685 [Microbacterium sp. AGC85]
MEIDGDIFVAPGLDWTLDTLVPYRPQSSTPLHRVASRPEIVVGDTVWIAGRTFVKRAKECNAVGEFAYEIGGWQAVALGFRGSFGHRRAFADMVRALRHNLERGLNQALFDHVNLLRFAGPILHELYAALPIEPDLEYQLTRALVFDGERDEYSLDFIRAETVHLLGLAPSEEEFDSQLEAKRRRLSASRLGERGQQGWIPFTAAPARKEADEVRKMFESVLAHSNQAPDSAMTDLFLSFGAEPQSSWAHTKSPQPTYNEKV